MSASGSRRRSAARFIPRRWTWLAADGIPTTASTPRRSARRPGRRLLTGRNHTRVGSGTIAERAVAWDGYTGVIPKNAATVAEVLKEYGYHTAAFGKWHNTPVTETTVIGPKDRWPNSYGFEYFYGFLGGETSQYEPRRPKITTGSSRRNDPSYHLTTDLVDKSLAWLDNGGRSIRTSRSSCIGRRAACTGRTMSSRSGPTSTRASSTAAGTPTASGPTSASSRWG